MKAFGPHEEFLMPWEWLLQRKLILFDKASLMQQILLADLDTASQGSQAVLQPFSLSPVPYFRVLAYLSLFSWHLSQLCPPGQTTTLTPTKWPEIPPVWIPVWSYTLLLHQSLRTFTMPSPAASAFPRCSFGNQCWTNKPTPESTLEETWDHVPQRQMGFAGCVSSDYTSTVVGYLSVRVWISRHGSEESTRTQPTPWPSLPEESVDATSLLPVAPCDPPPFYICSLPAGKAPCWHSNDPPQLC